MTGADPDPRVPALGQAVERVARRVDNVELLVRQLAADVAGLARVLEPPPEDGEDDGPGAGAVRSWLLSEDAAQARTDLADLMTWLAAVYLRYHGAALPSCWEWHPAVIEELWWLRQAHRAAYEGEGASWRDVGDWHDRQRPGVVKRIRAAIGGCDLARHAVNGDRRAAARPVVPLAGAADQIATAWTEHRTAPEPTPEQTHEANQHDQEQHRASHR